MPFEPTDFRVGLDIGICGRSIRIYDADQYTREFFDVSYKFSIILFYFIFRIWVNLKRLLKNAQRVPLLIHKNLSHRKKTQNSLSS